MSNSAHRGKPRRRPAIIALITLGSLVIGGTAAYAYWTTTGTGSGTATTGNNSPVVVNQAALANSLAPGVAAQTLGGTFNNPNPGAVQLTGVQVASVTTNKTGCTAADYSITGTGTVGNSGVVPSGTNVGSWTGLQIAFNNVSDRNQDACKDAIVTINYTASFVAP